MHHLYGLSGLHRHTLQGRDQQVVVLLKWYYTWFLRLSIDTSDEVLLSGHMCQYGGVFYEFQDMPFYGL
ncbi:hypothetical protein CHU95_00360 [Niveispirillum lacus]|uniref:Uncharacterized protein n=1 Tax=Niveispirillum lacus TaxID=1981099 RepID=A0A255Z8K1_9PROT|nr:hypothetical protein CHU95_00360 [Niveispirillum lacus]